MNRPHPPWISAGVQNYCTIQSFSSCFGSAFRSIDSKWPLCFRTQLSFCHTTRILPDNLPSRFWQYRFFSARTRIPLFFYLLHQVLELFSWEQYLIYQLIHLIFTNSTRMSWLDSYSRQGHWDFWYFLSFSSTTAYFFDRADFS